MPAPTTRVQFKEYILRKLGAPVIEINVAEEQVDDRVDEALSFWADYHYNGSQLVYLKHQLTQNDLDNGYIALPAGLLGIAGIFNMNTSAATGSGMFDFNYQFMLENADDIASFQMQNYYMSMQHIAMMQELLIGQPHIRYNKHVNRIYLDVSADKLLLGNYIIIEAHDVVDPAAFPDVWADRWLQNYATALVKENWGSNLTKFTGMSLVGGVQFNGDAILAEAREERKAMEEDAITSLQPLTYNWIG